MCVFLDRSRTVSLQILRDGATSWKFRMAERKSQSCYVWRHLGDYGIHQSGNPPEKTIVLAHLSAPRLARRGGQDDPFAWESREFLRKLCIGKDVVFRTEYTIPNFSREFCSVFIGTSNVGNEVVTHGWAKVKEGKRRGYS